MFDLVLRKARLMGAPGRVDLAVDQGIICKRGPDLDCVARQEIDLAGRLLVSGFVESHLHLDLALMNDWERPGRREAFRTHAELRDRFQACIRDFTREDIERRAGMALELASRQGVTAMRAQCSVGSDIGLKHLEALLATKARYAGRMSLQIVALPHQGLLSDPGAEDLVRQALRMGADVVGCSPNLEGGGRGYVDFRPHIDAAFRLAMEFGVDLDAHVDLGIPRRVALEDLEIAYLAQRAIETGYQGRVAAGHACALGSAAPRLLQEVIEKIRLAQISVISMPDMYRLGREDRRHVRRGLTRVKELLQAGVNVAYGSNNVRDVLRPFGNFDLLEEGLALAYGVHMDTIEELDSILRMSTEGAARALRLPGYGLEEGCLADMVVLDAPSASAALVGQVEKRYVFKAGRLVAASRRVGE